jgi:ketosteroid isomerase-like protein
MKNYLSVIPLVFLLCFVVGCQDKAAMAELEQFKAQAAVEQQNIELIRNFLKEMDAGNHDFVMDCFAPDAKLFWPSGSPMPSLKENMAQTLQSWYVIFPDYKHGIKEIIAKGDFVIVRVIDTATHEGDFQGIPATGNKIEVGATIIYRIKDGRIIEGWEDMDMLGMMQQLGMELKPKEAGK